MRKSIIMVTILYFLAFVLLYGEVNATPTIALSSVRVYTDYIGPNGGFIEEGRYFIIRAQVTPSAPGISIIATAKQDSVEHTLIHSPQPFLPLSDLYVFRTIYTGQGGAWEITADDGVGTPATIITYALDDPKELPLATNLSVSGDSLTPTLTWDPFDPVQYPSPFPPNPSPGYDLYTQTVMIRLAESGMPILFQSEVLPTNVASYTIPPNVLKENEEYLFDLFLVHLDSGTAGFNVENMSESFVYYSTVPPPEPVAIDIKPGSDPNSINPCSRGKISVAILTTDTLDARTVDPNTVLFGSNCSQAAPVQSALEDVDGDGDTDMILHFNTQDTWIQYGDTSASLTGETVSGQTFQGSDSIKTVECKRCFPPPAGLTGWWPGDGNTDGIIGGRSAVLQGDATTGPGFVGEAFILDGDGDFVDVPHDETLNVGTGDFTVDLWVFFNDTAGEQVLVEKWIQGVEVPSQGWTLTKLEDNVLLLAMADVSGEGAGVSTSEPLTILAGTWIHFAATRQSGQVTLFMNGVPVAQGESSLNLDSSSSLKFGHRGNMNDTEGSDSDQEFYLNGRIDEVELFVGQALTECQIRAIFNAGRAGKCKKLPAGRCFAPPAGLISWWRGEDGIDSVGPNNGILQGGTSNEPGMVELAFSFDGDDDYVEATDIGLPMGSSPRTLEMWVKPAFDARVPFIYGNFDPGDAYYAIVEGPNACIGQWADPSAERCGKTDVTDGEWHHLALTYDGAIARLYVDGVLEVVRKKVYATTSIGRAYIGSTVSGSEEYFAGLVDEVTVYARALKPSEIRFIFALGSAGKCLPVAECFSPPAGLTGWWPGDGNTDDIIGGRSAVLRGDATTGPGFVGEAFILDGDGDFVDVPHDEALNLGTGDFTVDLWVFFNDTAGEQILVEKWVQILSPSVEFPGSTGWTLTKLDDNVLLLAMADGSGAEIDVGSDVLLIPTGTWTHFAATRQGTQVTLFMNGAPIAQGEASLNLNSSSSLKFGHRGNPEDTPGSEDDRGFFLNGRIDEVELFVGQALTHDKIRAIFNARSAGKCKEQ